MLAFQEISIERAIGDKRLRLSWEPRISAQTLGLCGVHGILQIRSANGCWIDAEPMAMFSLRQLSVVWKWKLAQMKEVFSRLSCHLIQRPPGSNDFSVSLNLLPKQLYSDDWAVQLLDMAAAAGIPGSRIEIELLEHDDCINSLYVDWSFHALHNCGIRLVLANFPCGYHHLQRLIRHEFDKIIVIPSLLPCTSEPPAALSKRKALLNGVIHAIRGVGAKTILDRINNDLQFCFFSELEVAEGRGAYWGAPVETQDIPHLLSRLQKPTGGIDSPVVHSDTHKDHNFPCMRR